MPERGPRSGSSRAGSCRRPLPTRPARIRTLALRDFLLRVALLALATSGSVGGAAAAGGAADGSPAPAFRRAEGQRVWRFPRDHGQHPPYRLEWWYYTGIVRTAEGRPFGYQVTFFRQGLPGAAPGRPSAWAVRSLYLAHVALSDIAAQRYRHASRAGRDSLGLSGAAPDRHAVWLGPWRADALADDPHGVRLTVDAGDFALALTLHGRGPPLLHGTGGLDRKGDAPGQASWYYSQPRMETAGTLRVDGTQWRVEGSTWMDHEFGTSQLGPALAGWDWLALRLDDGSALMLYRLRRHDGTADPASGGDWVTADGRRTRLALGGADAPARDVRRATFTPGRNWHSPVTGADYPLEWHLTVPVPPEEPLTVPGPLERRRAVPGPAQATLELRITPAFDAQEQAAAPGTPFAYWEGAVWAEGTLAGRPVRGEGYLELTGYAGPLGGALR